MIGISTKNRLASCLLVILFAAALRLPLLLYFDVVAPDGTILMEMAETINNGKYFTTNVPAHHHHPLYPALIAAVSAILPLDFIRSGQIVSVFAALIAVLLVYRLAAEIYDHKVGIYSALTFSLVPSHALYSVMVLKESLYVLMALFVIYYSVCALKYHSKKYFVTAGLFFGFAYLTHFEGILLLLIIPVLYYLIRSEDIPNKKWTIWLAVTAAIGVYMVFAAVLFNQTGKFTISKKFNYYVNPVFATDAAKEKLIRDYGQKNADEIVRKNTKVRGFIAKRIEGVYKNTHYCLPFVFPILLMLFVGMGFAGFEFGKYEMFILIVPAIYLFIFPFLKYPSDYRYILCITPFLSIFAGKGLWFLQEKLLSKNQYLPKIFIIIFLIVFVPWVFKPIFDGKTFRDLLLHKKIGLFIGNYDQKKKDRIKIISPFPVISFYANAEHIYLGSIKAGQMINQLEKNKADYIVLSDLARSGELATSSQNKLHDFKIENIKKFIGMNGEEISIFEVVHKKT